MYRRKPQVKGILNLYSNFMEMTQFSFFLYQVVQLDSLIFQLPQFVPVQFFKDVATLYRPDATASAHYRDQLSS